MNSNKGNKGNKITLHDADIILALCQEWYISWLIKTQNSDDISAFLLNWTPVYLAAQLKSNPKYINKDGLEYNIRLFRSAEIDYIQAKKIAISFRRSKRLGLAVALIKAIY